MSSTTHHWTDATEHHGFHPHILPLKVYFAVFAALIVLTVATVGLYFLDPGHTLVHLGISPNYAHPINMVLSMLIATTKASLVALIFMHLLWDNKFYMLLFLGSLLFLAIFIIVTMFDTQRRGDIYKYRAFPTDLKADMYILGDHPVRPDFVPVGQHGAEHGGAEGEAGAEHGEAPAQH